MNQQQQQKRDAAVERLVGILGDQNISRDEAAAFVDDVIEAARPGRSDHAEAVEDLRRRSRDHEPGPVERATDEGSIGTGKDRNVVTGPDPRD